MVDYLVQFDGSVQCTDKSIFDTISKLPLRQKRGMWVKIASNQGCGSMELQNYYHNTFIKNLFSDPRQFKEELAALVQNQRSLFDSEEIFQQFSSKHSELMFNSRLTKQYIAVLNKRMMERASNEAPRQVVQRKSVSEEQQAADIPFVVDVDEACWVWQFE
uniref:Uncharacterized protein n=1 Tax=Trepomonas sp. PC1 TaxID=1076344 RepID=A0A146K7D0_9EUKA|eukprot:JAP92527.1 Hypothetical protein TPC1_15499 [Trepomonas sp. PC1]